VESVEVTNLIYIIADGFCQKSEVAYLFNELSMESLSEYSLEIRAFGGDDVKIEVTLATTAVNRKTLDAMIQRRMSLLGIRQAFWTPSTSEQCAIIPLNCEKRFTQPSLLLFWKPIAFRSLQDKWVHK